jgi:hypothetical protein
VRGRPWHVPQGLCLLQPEPFSLQTLRRTPCGPEAPFHPRFPARRAVPVASRETEDSQAFSLEQLRALGATGKQRTGKDRGWTGAKRSERWRHALQTVRPAGVARLQGPPPEYRRQPGTSLLSVPWRQEYGREHLFRAENRSCGSCKPQCPPTTRSRHVNGVSNRNFVAGPINRGVQCGHTATMKEAFPPHSTPHRPIGSASLVPEFADDSRFLSLIFTRLPLFQKKGYVPKQRMRFLIDSLEARNPVYGVMMGKLLLGGSLGGTVTCRQ